MPTFRLPRRSLFTGAFAVSAGAALAKPAAVPSDRSGTLDAGRAGLAEAPGRDRTAEIQRLLDAAARDGKLLLLPPGRFEVGRLRLPSETRLAGVPGGGTRLVGPALRLTARGAKVLVLRDLTLDGAGGGTEGGLLDVADCESLLVEACEVLNAGRHGIVLEKVRGRIAGCAVRGAGDVALFSRDAAGFSIEGNTIEDAGNGGILVHRSAPGPDGTTVAGNRLARIAAKSGGTGPFGNGINVFRASGVIVSANQIDGCAFSAIRCNGASGAVIANNRCNSSGETAIYAEFGFEGAVIQGNVVDGAATGVSIANFMQGGRLAACTGNLVRNLKRTGPYPADSPGFGMGISVEADTVLANNVVESAPLFALKLGWGPYLRDVAATGNVLREGGVGIAVSAVEGAGAALISGNVISAMRGGAVVGFRWRDAATPDLARDPTAAPAHVSLANNVVS